MNKKGFTLVEVLAAVTIIVLITIIAVPTSIKFIERGKNEQYDILEGQIISAANKYYIKHKNEICLTLDTFINEIDDKFIKENKIIDPKTNKELIGRVEIIVDENNVEYNLIKEETNSCKLNSPTLALGDGWYTGSTAKDSITEINIVDRVSTDFKNSADESWSAAVDSNGNLSDDIKCYIHNTTLTIVGNKSGKIIANSDSSRMFYGFKSIIEINGLSFLDTSNVTNMTNMFNGCNSLINLDLSNFDTSNVTTMPYMFSRCNNLINLKFGNFSTSNVTDMGGMFYNCNSLTNLDLSSFDTSDVKYMSYMFYQCNNIKTIYVSDKFVTTKVTDSLGMFENTLNLVGGNGTAYNNSNKNHTYARIDTPETPGYFTQK